MGEICTEVQFLKDVSKHQMIVLRDDGISRHIRFKQPNTGNRYFDLITWDGCLCYNGDMGTFVFSRIPDMFEFFRQDRSQVLRDGKTLAINLGYWGEKLQSISRFGGYEEFDGDKFKQVINEYRIQWMRDMKDADDSKEDRRELWEAVDDYVMAALDEDSGGIRAQTAAHDFSHNTADNHYYFQDLFEHSFTRHSFYFVWCCYALAWGIAKYDEETGEKK